MTKREIVWAVIGGCLAVFILSVVVSTLMFTFGMELFYHQFDVVAQGKLERYTDCMGDSTVRIGQYDVDNNIKIWAKGHTEGGMRTRLKGGDCEYVLYKGWWWGLGDLYYIEAK